MAFPLLLGGCLGARVGCSMTVTTTAGRTNMPKPGSQSKYRSPWTVPSFFPVGSSNSTPIQSPSAKWVAPTYRTVAWRPSDNVTTCPEETTTIVSPKKGFQEPRSEALEIGSSCLTRFCENDGDSQFGFNQHGICLGSFESRDLGTSLVPQATTSEALDASGCRFTVLDSNFLQRSRSRSGFGPAN